MGDAVTKSGESEKRSLLARLAPGILVAATGVGAGDLLTAGFAGSRLGMSVAWAALAGALLKWVLNEGVARWQMATGDTLLEGWVGRLGSWIKWLFAGYLLIWTVVTGTALVSACGVAGAGLFTPNIASDAAESARWYWGIGHAWVGLILVWFGGYRLFEKMMSLFIAIMFIAVISTAVLIKPDWAALGAGLLRPTIPKHPEALNWILGIIGGVGGTVTLLCYGYWIREKGRYGAAGVRACRLDLAVGYGMTAIFGVAMIVIGSRVDLQGKGASMAPILAQQLGNVMGPIGRWAFLIGFWGAVFSSLLGVWQSVPYLFTDFLLLAQGKNRNNVDFDRTPSYRAYLIFITIAPLPFISYQVAQIQLAYAVLGALFMPLLALTLLLMNTRVAWVGQRFRSHWAINALLVLTLLFFGWTGAQSIREKFAPKDEQAKAAAENTPATNQQASAFIAPANVAGARQDSLAAIISGPCRSGWNDVYSLVSGPRDLPGQVAQLVEQRIENPCVAGSNPALPSSFRHPILGRPWQCSTHFGRTLSADLQPNTGAVRIRPFHPVCAFRSA